MNTFSELGRVIEALGKDRGIDRSVVVVPLNVPS